MPLLDFLTYPNDPLLEEYLMRQKPNYVPPGLNVPPEMMGQPQVQAAAPQASPTPPIAAPAPQVQPQVPKEIPPPANLGMLEPEEAASPTPYLNPLTERIPGQAQGILGDWQAKQTQRLQNTGTLPENIAPTVPAEVPPLGNSKLPEKAAEEGTLGKPKVSFGDRLSKMYSSSTFPLALGLLQAGAGFMTPTYGGFGGSVAQGLGGLSQGLLSGAQMQSLAQNRDMMNQLRMATLMGKITPKTPNIVEVEGKKFLRLGDRLSPLDSKTTKTEAERYAETAGVGLEEAHQLIEQAKARGRGLEKPPKDYTPQYFETSEGKGIWVKPGEPIPEGAKPKGSAGELDLSPAAINAMADRYMIDGTMPGLGLGKAATKARSMVMNRVAEKMAAGEISPADLVSNKIVAGGLRAEANRLLGQRGPMLAFAQTADKNLDIALELSQKADRTGVPVLNRWLLAGKKQIAGDPDVSAFHAATQVAVNEFAKVTSSATGGGVTSDTARKEIESVLNEAQTPQQFQAVVETLRRDMGNRIQGYESSLKRLQEAAGQLGKVQGAGAGQRRQEPSTPTIRPGTMVSGFVRSGTYRNPMTGQMFYARTPEEYNQVMGAK